MHVFKDAVTVLPRSGRLRSLYALALTSVLLSVGACDDRSNLPAASGSRSSRAVQDEDSGKIGEVPLPKADQKVCTAVAILLDTSGSMADKVRDQNKKRVAKHLIARNSLEKIIGHTDDWKKKHPDRALQLALLSFCGDATTALPMADFNRDAALGALTSIPQPNGGTAIGEALKAGFEALYASGCTRKYIICITDGENTVSVPPDVMARQLYSQTGGEVEIHFVAFDTAPEKFRFLSEVNGYVVPASGNELDARLSDIYEKRILAETMPAER